MLCHEGSPRAEENCDDEENSKRLGDSKGRQTSTGHLIPAVNSACRGKFAFQRASTGVPGEDWI
jgi:hypothetical protein